MNRARFLLLFLGLAVSGLDSFGQGTNLVERIAFGSCANQTKPQPFWRVIADQKPQLFIFCGDNVYADTEDMEIMNRRYQMLGDKEGYQALKEICPVLATWDDHDYGVNDGGRDYPMRKQASEIMLDFFEVPLDDPRRSRDGIYGAKVFGPEGRRVQVVLLDTRFFRSPLNRVGRRDVRGPYAPMEKPGSTMLGEAQWAWLEKTLRQPAELRVVVSSIQVVSSEHGWESWGNLPRERQRLFDLIAKTEANGVIFISGDRHLAELSSDQENGPYPLYDMTSSGLVHSGGGRPQEPNRYRVLPMYQKTNFGWIEVDWEAGQVLLMARSTLDGVPVLQKAVKLSTLQAP